MKHSTRNGATQCANTNWCYYGLINLHDDIIFICSKKSRLRNQRWPYSCNYWEWQQRKFVREIHVKEAIILLTCYGKLDTLI